jgi:hypothetical protein
MENNFAESLNLIDTILISFYYINFIGENLFYYLLSLKNYCLYLTFVKIIPVIKFLYWNQSDLYPTIRTYFYFQFSIIILLFFLVVPVCFGWANLKTNLWNSDYQCFSWANFKNASIYWDQNVNYLSLDLTSFNFKRSPWFILLENYLLI